MPPPQSLGGLRGSLGPEEIRSPALSLLSGALESQSPLLRCLAAEGLARLVQVLGEPGFTVSVSLLCFDRWVLVPASHLKIRSVTSGDRSGSSLNNRQQVWIQVSWAQKLQLLLL